MNSENHYNKNHSSEQDYYTSQTIRKDGLIKYSNRNTDISVYSPKTPYAERKAKNKKGSNGLSRKEQDNIELAIHTFETEYGLCNCKWIVLTFDECASDEALKNLLTNLPQLRKSINYSLDKQYKKLDVQPYIIVSGIRERTSYNRGIPCLDINIVCVTSDEHGKDLINVDTFVRQVYESASKLAKETIKVPNDCYCHELYNTKNDYRRLSSYLKNQVDTKVLMYFRNTDYALLLPNSWVHIHASLLKTFTSHKAKYERSTVKEHREILQKHFDNDVTFKDDGNCEYKCVAQLKDSSPEFINGFISRYNQVFNKKSVSLLETAIALNPELALRVRNDVNGGELKDITDIQLRADILKAWLAFFKAKK